MTDRIVGKFLSARREVMPVNRGFVVVEDEGHGKRRVPVTTSIIIGRSADCDIIIDDAAASRHHVEVRKTGADFTWKDLGSTNGTLLNGKSMLEGALSHGDVIRIGETSLTFELEVVAESAQSEESSLFRTLITADGESLSAERESMAAEEALRTVYAFINQIAANYEPAELVDTILQTCVKAINAQRAAVLFAGPDGVELTPCPETGKFHLIENGRLRHVNREGVQISETVAHRVLSRGESVLFEDTSGEASLQEAASVQQLELRSIMCVPLRGKHGILGLLYVDTNRPGQSYSREDMLLATAVGNSAGLALENARLYQEIIEKERTDQEIRHAWTIQQGFLVKQWPIGDARFRVYGETRPAKTVGGDFYDFVQPSKDRVGILIGDVSGKGVPAALTMAQILAEFRLAARDHESPAKVLGILNVSMAARAVMGTFCTICYATLDLKTGRALIANAGHPSALGVSRQGVRGLGEASGPPIGILPDGSWSDEEVMLEPGESILLYTDGITEARGMHTRRDTGSASDEFGERNLKRVAQGFGMDSPQEMIGGILLSVQEYTAPAAPHDDCTLVALAYEL